MPEGQQNLSSKPKAIISLRNHIIWFIIPIQFILDIIT
ncbi:hypothetical protein DERF_005217 [Dermatophagoides farinae]|uniref:Uncharacterized protein n=1 Tax=Dermatophagoides farinae TaxID=6954 RepID=A0A922L6Y0_DERFA|nr:hypothetical protein DERF_005217 [Dermatophagoides farinae]